MGKSERVAFNINAELYENEFGELAVKVPGEKVFRNVGIGEGARFQGDVTRLLQEQRRPPEWSEMPAHELTGRGWRCVAALGYLAGDLERPAVEFETGRDELGTLAQSYLADAAPPSRVT